MVTFLPSCSCRASDPSGQVLLRGLHNQVQRGSKCQRVASRGPGKVLHWIYGDRMGSGGGGGSRSSCIMAETESEGVVPDLR